MAPDPTSLLPCCVQILPLRVNTQAAPMAPLSKLPPMTAVFPSALMATPTPCCAIPVAPDPTSLLPCCAHVSPLRVKTQAAPVLPLSTGAPKIAVLPSALMDTLHPR